MPRGRPRKDTVEEKQIDTELDQQSNEEAKDVQEIVRPRYVDPEWHSFVMSQFVPEELDNHGNPKVDGLRRVAEGLLGEIIESRPVQSSSSLDMAAVNWILVFSWVGDNPYIDDGGTLPTRTFGAFADCTMSNCKAPYNKFLASLADTRAESKALRRALRLRCISSEEAELGETNTFEEKVSDGSYKGEAPLNEQQKMMIVTLSLRNGIDENKLIEKTFPGKNLDGINLLTKENAANIILLLNKYQTRVKDGSEEVPQDIKRV